MIQALKHKYYVLFRRGLIIALGFLLLIGGESLVMASGGVFELAPRGVELQRAGGEEWLPARRGMIVNEGDTVRTGRRKTRIRWEDGTRLEIRANSRLLVEEMTKKKRSFSLGFGRLKAFVKRFSRGRRKFEVRTPVAVASVRGTEFSVGFDPGKQRMEVDVDKGLVGVTTVLGEEVELGAGESLSVVKGVIENNREKKESKRRESKDRGEVRREVSLDMSKEEVLAAAAEELKIAEYQQGKTLVDVFGKRVRLEEYIIRPADDQFKLVVLNEREDRFDYFFFRGLFNKDLPEDLSVALVNLNGKLGSTSPEWHLTEYEMAQSNTSDSVIDRGAGGHLVQVTFDGTDYTLTESDSNGNLDTTNTKTIQAVERQSGADGTLNTADDVFKVYDPMNDVFSTLAGQPASGESVVAVFDPDSDTFRTFTSVDTYWKTRYDYYSHVLRTGGINYEKQSYVATGGTFNGLSFGLGALSGSFTPVLASDTDANWTFAGGFVLTLADTPSGSDVFHNRIRLEYGDGTNEIYNTYIISDEGKIAPTSAFSGISTGKSFKEELLKWNYEQTIEATEFEGRKIDLVVEPKILIQSGLIK